MNRYNEIMIKALEGKGSHVSYQHAFDELSWEQAFIVPPDHPHSIWELLNHIVYWQEFSLSIIKKEDPELPEHASESWNAGDCNPDSFAEVVARFMKGVEEVRGYAAQPLDLEIGKNKTLMEELMAIIGHNSYHLGQIVQIRRVIGAWPPPSGGDTW